ncbi:tetratricopeptide repeat protein [Psychrobacter phenylpyruvicus]|uniref:Uncharacterized protein n=1 Tax=Psychrobacter phenylpyruvicus TaxID=29432 RepID=A0A379LIK1_9GAMM|nr:tetratricopeptide repeat protein [Psychrobacter phenylpyruvicus]SUD90439.1 Uncharacterised protein [Psychrobacter phenylpyruvicus]
MSMQSQVSVTTAAKTSVKVSPLKSLLMSSALSVLMVGVLTGCQSTGGLSTPSAVTVTQPTTQTSPNTATPADSSSTAYQDLEEDYPISQAANDIETGVQDLRVEHQTSYPLQQSRTESSQEPIPSDDSTTSVNPKAVGQTIPTSPIPNATNEAPVVKPPVTDAKTVHQSLLEQARQNSKKPTNKPAPIQDGSNLPAFQKLMDTGVEQLRQGQVSAAQATFTRAQRLAPQSSAVYFYLGQVALKQNQPLKAEAMARRGLVVAQTEARKRALWQIILIAGQAQGNTRVIKEAKAALSR